MFAIQASSTPTPDADILARSWIEGERIRSAERGNIRSYMANMASTAESARQFNIQEARIARAQAQANKAAKEANRQAARAAANNAVAKNQNMAGQASQAATAAQREAEASKAFDDRSAPTTNYQNVAVPQTTTRPPSINLMGDASQMNLSTDTQTTNKKPVMQQQGAVSPMAFEPSDRQNIQIEDLGEELQKSQQQEDIERKIQESTEESKRIIQSTALDDEEKLRDFIPRRFDLNTRMWGI